MGKLERSHQLPAAMLQRFLVSRLSVAARSFPAFTQIAGTTLSTMWLPKLVLLRYIGKRTGTVMASSSRTRSTSFIPADPGHTREDPPHGTTHVSGPVTMEGLSHWPDQYWQAGI